MKSVLVLAAVLGVAYAGVGTLSPQEESEALQLFERLCGGYGSEQGQDIGGTLVYCKRARDDRQETLNHNVNINTDNRQPGQVVFVQPPPVRYQHRVLIQGSGSQGQQTKVYVLPQKATHELTADYKGGQTTQQKPTVYFLKGDGQAQPSNGYGPPANQQPQPQPQPGYGAPLRF